MGTWGTRIYEDDIALDLRGDFLDRYHDGETVESIEAAIKEEYIEDDVPEVTDVVVLALACVELETATLTKETKQAALEVIESGRQYKHWQDETSSAEAGRRKRELTLVKSYLDQYDGLPVKRKSWTELQKEDGYSDNTDENEKIEDVEWHMQEDIPGISEKEYFARHAGPIACMVHWIVTRDHSSNEFSERFEANEYKTGETDIFTRIADNMDQKLLSTDIKPGLARKFVQAYYSVSFYEDFAECVENDRPSYSYVTTAGELDAMAMIIDKRFKEYTDNPSVFTVDDVVDVQAKSRSVPKAILGILILLLLTGVSIGLFILVIYGVWQILSNLINSIF